LRTPARASGRRALWELRLDRAGRDHRRANVVRFDFLAQAFGERPDRVLGRGDRGDADDVAALALLHRRQHGGDPVEHALDVHVDRAVPVVDVQPLERCKCGIISSRDLFILFIIWQHL